MFKNKVLQMRITQPTDPATGDSEPKIDLDDVTATAVTTIKTIMREGTKFVAAWVVLDTARKIAVNMTNK